MKQFFNIFKFELIQKFKDKSFIISMIFTAVLVLGLTFIPRIFSDDKGSETNTTVSEADTATSEEVYKESLLLMYDGEVDPSTKEAINASFEVTEAKSVEEIEQKIKDEEFSKGVVIHSDISATSYSKNEGIMNFNDDRLKSVLEDNYKYNIALSNIGISKEQYNSIDKTRAEIENVELGKNGMIGYGISYGVLMFLYFTILMNGQQISTSVAKEKSSRAMEILITNTKAKYLIWGKVIAGTVATIIQSLILIISGYIGYLINFSQNESISSMIRMATSQINISVILFLFIFVIVGIVMYNFLFASLGSLVDKVEDLAQAVMPVTLLVIFAFMGTFMFMSNPNSAVITATSFIPFSSPLAIFPRYLMTDMPMIEVLISLLILVLTTLLAAFVSIKIYRHGTLNYGNKANIFKILISKSE